MTRRRRLRPLAAALAIAAALIGAGCSNSSGEDDTDRASTTEDTARDKAVRFADCMRDNGVTEFPDPDASGELTIDAVVNGSSLDADSPVFEQAMSACKDLQPAGFTGHKRNDDQQDSALAFAQCMRDNGIKDFPDPVPDGPLIDTTRIPSAAGRGALEIPGFTEATEKCGRTYGDELGIRP